MKVYIAIRHSGSYYDEYEEEEVLAVCKLRKTAIKKILKDMERKHIDEHTLSFYSTSFYKIGNKVGLWEIIPIKTEF